MASKHKRPYRLENLKTCVKRLIDLRKSEVTREKRSVCRRAEDSGMEKESRNESIISVEEGKKYYKFEAEWLL
jgi:hypothetical protein